MPQEQEYSYAVVVSDGLNLRARPSASSRKIDALSKGARVRVLKREEDTRWVFVRVTSSGLEGWMATGDGKSVWLEDEKPLPAEPPFSLEPLPEPDPIWLRLAAYAFCAVVIVIAGWMILR